MSQLYRHERIQDIGTQLFAAAGAEESQAAIATAALVQSSLMGHDSHGVMRIPEYLGFIDDGSLKPAAETITTETGPSTARIDCGYGFGAVGGAVAIEKGIEIAREHQTACVITRECNHVGRLGAYTQMAADAGFIALATCNSPIYGHFVLPFGGKEGRLATNPIAYGIPTAGDPVVADFSTSVAPEGKIRFYRNEGKSVPDGWILDAEGNPTNDPNEFYGPPRGGILPLGSNVAHKGFALSLLVEVFGSALAGVSSKDTEVFGNGVCFIVMDPSAFCPLDRFRELMSETVQYMKSSPPAPGFDEVYVPGELEFKTQTKRLESGIPIDPSTWDAICEYAERFEMNFEE